MGQALPLVTVCTPNLPPEKRLARTGEKLDFLYKCRVDTHLAVLAGIGQPCCLMQPALAKEELMPERHLLACCGGRFCCSQSLRLSFLQRLQSPFLLMRRIQGLPHGGPSKGASLWLQAPPYSSGEGPGTVPTAERNAAGLVGMGPSIQHSSTA